MSSCLLPPTRTAGSPRTASTTHSSSTPAPSSASSCRQWPQTFRRRSSGSRFRFHTARFPVLLHLMPTPISNFRRAAVFRCQVCLDGRVQPAQCVLSLSFIQLQVSDLLPVACELCCREPLSHSLTPCASAAANGTSGVQVVVSPSLSSPTGHNALCLDKLRACAAPAASPPPIRSSETCCLPFSSGTTGVPKGVVLSHRH